MTRPKTVTTRTRVRMEFTAFPKGPGAGFIMDKRFTTLRVMLKERFGFDGIAAFDEWMLETAVAQEDKVHTRTFSAAGGRR